MGEEQAGRVRVKSKEYEVKWNTNDGKVYVKLGVWTAVPGKAKTAKEARNMAEAYLDYKV